MAINDAFLSHRQKRLTLIEFQKEKEKEQWLANTYVHYKDQKEPEKEPYRKLAKYKRKEAENKRQNELAELAQQRKDILADYERQLTL